MAKFPEIDSLSIGNPVNVQMLFKTLSTNFAELGKSQRKQKWLFPKRQIKINCPWITKAELETLMQFYAQRYGGFSSFNFFVPEPNNTPLEYLKEYVGTGNGSNSVFNLPSKNATGYVVYKDNSTQSGGGVDYTFVRNDGEDGVDKLIFTSAPATGERITYTFTGILKVRCVFVEDNLDYDLMYDRLVNSNLTLQGLLNDE